MSKTGVLTLDDLARGSSAFAASDALIEIQKGFYLARTDIALEGTMTHSAEAFPFIGLSVLMDGRVETDVPGLDVVDNSAALIVSQKEHRELLSRLHGSPRLRNVEVFVTPDWFERPDNRLAGDPTFAQMRDFLDRGLVHQRLPASMRLREIATSVLSSTEGGAIAALRLEAHALELLSVLAGSFETHARSAALAPRDRDRVFAIRQKIEADPASVESLAALAAAHGVSASKLKRDFFLAFSTCVGSFVNECRLTHARDLIEQGMAVSQAAYSVGYAHPTNFSTAFKRRFGVSPRSVRH